MQQNDIEHTLKTLGIPGTLVSKMDESELRAFVGRLPPVVLKQVRPKRVER